MPIELPFRHPALEPVEGAVPLASARLADREVVALTLQAACLLSHLGTVGWRLARGWESARVDRDGILRAVEVVEGPSPPRHGPLSALLLRGLGGVDSVEGRGVARRAARRLLERWADPLLPMEPDLAVGEILELAPFLWEAPSAAARRALVATVSAVDGQPRRVLVAAPPEVRARFLELPDTETLADRLASAEGRSLWARPRSDLAPSSRSLLAALELAPPTSPAGRLELAQALFDDGRFERALEVAERLPGDSAGILVARCRQYLGDLRGAREALRAFDDRELPGAILLELADAAMRILANAGEAAAAAAWAKRVLDEVGGDLAPQAHRLAALAAWDADDVEAMDRHLAASASLAGTDQAWQWHAARGLAALHRGDGLEMEAALVAALGSRRRLGRVAAASLWNDLAVARVLADRLPQAEKAQANAVRLQRRLDGPRKTTLGLRNLAEIRLRRGRLDGVREILEASIARNRVDDQVRGLVHDWVLWARLELLQGHPLASLETLAGAEGLLDAKASNWHRAEIAVIRARALGWLGRSGEAAEALSGSDAEARGMLGPEERPALFAHAGDRDGALGEAADVPQRRHWQALLTGSAAPRNWERVDRLEPLRRARLFYDWEILSPGFVPAPRLRWAAALLERSGASAIASFLETRVGGPWEALARFGELERIDEAAIGELFAAAGWSHVQLEIEPLAGPPRRLVDGVGGSERLAREIPLVGELRLATTAIDARARSLFAAVARRLERTRPVVAPVASVPATGRGPRGFVGASESLRAALDRLGRLARGELPLLILGESGTGKELAARYAHSASPRAAGPLLPVNCAALSENLLLSELFGHVKGSFTGADRDRAGVFEAARGGTVFLDEIGDLPPVAQGMLLRVLQEREIRRVGESMPRKVDVRVLAATHRDLAQMVGQGTFRQDLFYRLRVGVVELPPLRERGDDALLLAERVLERARPGVVLSAEARGSLLAHSWPGNVRELENVIEAAAALTDDEVITAVHLQLPVAGAGGSPGGEGFGYHERVQAFRRRLVEDALRAAGGRQAEAARSLGLTRQSLSYLVRQLRIVI